MTANDDDTLPARDSSKAPRAETTERAPQRIGRYELGEVVDRNQMAVVYRAQDPELHRDVVIHVLNAESNADDKRALETARAFAKVRDSSLVPIFDVGLTEGRVYLVMQQIGGKSMSEWLASSARSWREVVIPFLRAARGLQAAHSAGISHRTLSTDSIILDGSDVFVSGFAFTADHASEHVAIDQQALRDAFRKALADKNPPAWLNAAIEKSWPDLTSFATHLEEHLPRPKRKAIVAGAAAIVGIGAVASFLAFSRSRPDPCPDPRPRLVGAWDVTLRTHLEAGFKTAAPAIATGTLARLVPSLDAYAERWRATQIETCEATFVKRTQAPELFDRRTDCLERRLGALRSLVTAMTTQPVPTVVVRAEEAFAALPDIGDCERTEQLMAMAPRPTDAALRASIDDIERELDEIQALRIRGDNKIGMPRVRKAVENARASGYGPVLAHALFLLARYEEDARLDSREATLRELAQVAADARADRLTALAWIRLMNVLGAGKGKPSEAQALEPVAEAAVIRAGASPELLFEFHLAGVGTQMTGNNLAEADRHLSAAIAAAADDRSRALVAQYRAKLTLIKSGPAAGLPLAEEALRITETAVGPDHPLVADVLDLMSQAHAVGGNFDAAEASARRQLSILEGVFGPIHTEMATPLRVLAHIATMRGNYNDAKEFARRALAIAEQSGNPQRLATAQIAYAQALAMSDGFATARSHYQQGLATMEKVRGKDHPTYVNMENEYAAKLVDNGLCAEALPLLEHSIGVFEKNRPELTALPRYHRAKCAEGAGRIAEAIADYERANADCRKASCEPLIALGTAGALGKALVSTRRDPVRGAALLNEARAGFEAKGMKDHVDETDRMMKAVGVKRR